MITQAGVQSQHDDIAEIGPFVTAALFWITGTAAGAWVGGRMYWLSAAVVLLLAALVLLRRRSPRARRVALLAAMALAGSWTIVRTDYVPDDHIAHYLSKPAQLAHVTGRIASRVNVMAPQRGAFARFSYEPPATMFSLEVDTLVIDGERVEASGMLLAKIEQADHRLREGDRVAVSGWLAPIDGPHNPGEIDFRQVMRDRGIDGRITMRVRGNCRVLDGNQSDGWFPRVRRSASDAAANSLRIGMASNESRLAFLDTILLGRWGGDMGELRDSFRDVGLAHLLSISGAHLGILLWLVWMVLRLIVPYPNRATLIVLIVLVFYLMAVPWRVPIIRAGIMAALVCTGFASGRRVRAVDMIAVAAIVVLIWRPADLFTAGFQLSFGIVAGLLLFVRPVSHWLWAEPLIIAPVDQGRMAVIRKGVDYVAVNIVAFLIALPLVAYHFQIISPLAVLLSILAFPVVTLLLGLGYLKIIVGFMLPSGGALLAGPLLWISDTMTGLVEHATTWPGATVNLNQQPSVLWTVAALAIVIALLRGAFARRRRALACAAAICLAWLIVPGLPAAQQLTQRLTNTDALHVNMFAVGDGSCFLVRVKPGELDGHTFMFDCGSQAFLDTGQRTIGPALRALGVGRLDTLFLSHADLDHFSGVIDMLDHVTVSRVLVPPQLLTEAEANPDSSVGHLVAQLRARGLFPQTVARGWSESWGDAEAKLFWPPPDYEAERANDSSLVLSVRIGDRSLLLNGDIARQATPDLLALNDDLTADITDLPHHGSFTDDSPRWLAAVKPSIVLQSSGPTRLQNDKWAATIDPQKITRLITARLGMVEIIVDRDGRITWSSFRAPKRPPATQLNP